MINCLRNYMKHRCIKMKIELGQQQQQGEKDI